MTEISLSVLPPLRPAGKLALAALLMVWVLAAHAQLAQLYLPWMDSWCYFAPGVLAEQPLSVHMPLMGSFQGADQTWGIHWPGIPLFFSLLGAWTGLRPQDYSWVIVALWLAAAWLSGVLARRLSDRAWVPLLAMAAVLMDPGVLNVATCRRPEMVAMVVLVVWLLIGWHVLDRRGKGWLGIGFGVVTAVTVVCHPVLTVAMAGAAALSLLLAFFGKLPSRIALAQSAGALLGAALLGLWLMQPHAWQQFSDHAQVASPGGLTLGPERGAWHLYAPSPGMFLALFLCAVGVVAVIRTLCVRDNVVPPAKLFSLLTLVLVLGACHLFSNYHYVVIASVIVWPVALTVMGGSTQWCSSWPRPAAAVVWVVLWLALCGGNAILFAKRGVALACTPGTNIAADLQRWYDAQAPQAARVLFPDVLWEAASQDKQHQVQLLTPAYVVKDAVRKDYEAELYATLGSGDVVIEDLEAQYNASLSRPWIDEHWPLVAQRDFLLPKRLHLSNARFSSYQLRVYRKP